MATTAARLTLLTAGWTSHPAGVARRGAGRDPIRFPALVGVVEHPRGVVLFDTGYAPRVQRAVARGIDRVYGALLPVHVSAEETAVAQLAARGIAADDVAVIVLSHLHADHVGGLRDFPGAQVVTAPGVLDDARRRRGFARLRRGLLPTLLPSSRDNENAILDPATLEPAIGTDLDPLPGGRDLWGDGSVVIVPLPGHSDGHLGLLVRCPEGEVLLVGDAVWDLRAATHGELPHPVARLTTADWHRYRATATALGRLAQRRPDVVIVPSHDQQAINAAQAILADAPRGDAG